MRWILCDAEAIDFEAVLRAWIIRACCSRLITCERRLIIKYGNVDDSRASVIMSWGLTQEGEESVDVSKSHRIAIPALGYCPGVQLSMHASRELAPKQHLLSSDVNSASSTKQLSSMPNAVRISSWNPHGCIRICVDFWNHKTGDWPLGMYFNRGRSSAFGRPAIGAHLSNTLT